MKRGLALAAAVVATLAALTTYVRRSDQLPPEKGTPQVIATLPSALPSATSPSSKSTQANTAPGAAPSSQNTPSTPSFSQLTEKVQAELPRTEELRRLSAEDAHGMPLQLREAGRRLGEVSQALHANPALVDEGLKFYRQCAQRSEIPDSLRALCFANLRNLSQASGKPEFFQAGDYPEGVRKLGDHIPPGW